MIRSYIIQISADPTNKERIEELEKEILDNYPATSEAIRDLQIQAKKYSELYLKLDAVVSDGRFYEYFSSFDKHAVDEILNERYLRSFFTILVRRLSEENEKDDQMKIISEELESLKQRLQ